MTDWQAIQAQMSESYLEVVTAHPEWPAEIVSLGWDAIVDQNYAALDKVLARLDQFSAPKA